MENYLIEFIQVNLYLIVFIALYQLFIKKEGVYRFSRWYLYIGIIISLLLPFVNFELTSNSVSSFTFHTLLETVIVNSSAVNNSKAFNVFQLLTLIYGLGAITLFIKHLFGFTGIYKLAKKSVKKEDYYLVKNNASAFSFFHSIYIGDQIPEESRKVMLAHEKIHRQQLHSVDIVFAHLLEIIFWYNPLIYKLKNNFKEIHEFEADEKACSDREAYINLLLQQNFNQYDISFIHSFNSNFLKQRIMKIQSTKKSTINKFNLLITMVLFGGLFLLNQNLNAQSQQKIKATDKEGKEIEVDKLPEFPGGNNKLMTFWAENIVYPEKLKKEGIEGTVYTRIVIDHEGKVISHKTLRGVEGAPEFEAVVAAVVEKLPDFEPGEKDGKTITTSLVIPTKFKLNSKKQGVPPPPPPPPKPPVSPESPESPKG